MISLPYSNLDNALETKISGGRKHFTYRPLAVAHKSYRYEVIEGENYHSLAMQVFGDDALWWVIADINPAKEAFNFEVGDAILLPEVLVPYNKGENRIVG